MKKKKKRKKRKLGEKKKEKKRNKYACSGVANLCVQHEQDNTGCDAVNAWMTCATLFVERKEELVRQVHTLFVLDFAKEMGSTDESFSNTGYEPKDYFLTETYVESLTQSVNRARVPRATVPRGCGLRRCRNR